MKETLIFISAILLIACNPEDLDIGDNDTRFKVQMELNSTSRIIEAGKNNFFLSPGFEFENDVLVFTSSFLKDESCELECDERLTIKIADFQKYNDQLFNINESLEVGAYSYVSQEEISLTNFFFQLINTSIATGPYTSSWTVGGQDVFTAFPNILNYELPDLISTLDVGLQIEGPGCKSKVTKVYSSESNFQSNCDASIKIIDTLGISAAYIEARGAEPFDIRWEGSQTDIAGMVFLQDMNTDVLTASVTDATGCSVQITLDLNGMVSGNCLADFNYNFLEPALAVAGLSGVSIEYEDAGGVIYSSRNLPQDTGNQFLINSIHDYLNDENGFPTKELNIEFSADLASPHGDIIRFNNSSATIAVSYPSN